MGQILVEAKLGLFSRRQYRTVGTATGRMEGFSFSLVFVSIEFALFCDGCRARIQIPVLPSPCLGTFGDTDCAMAVLQYTQ